MRLKNVWKILGKSKQGGKEKNQGLVLFWDLPDFLWILSIYRDLPDLFFSTFLAHQKDLQGAFLKASGTQSGPFSSEPEAGHIKAGRSDLEDRNPLKLSESKLLFSMFPER